MGLQNQQEVDQYLQKVMSRRGIGNVFIIGDFNMPSINWEDVYSSNPVEQSFLTTFSNLGFDQLVEAPTHARGNTLDILLTNNASLVGNIKVDSVSNVCKSAHFPILFDIKARCKKVKTPKREIYDFSTANWDSINSEISSVNWDSILLSSDNIEFAWLRFKEKLFEITDRNIDKIKINFDKQVPWFDSESDRFIK